MHVDAGTQWTIGVIVSGGLALYGIIRASRAAEREAVRHDAEFEGATNARLTELERFRAQHEADHRATRTSRDAR